jgi:DNA-binding NarL/FixJ family response regulator
VKDAQQPYFLIKGGTPMSVEPLTIVIVDGHDRARSALAARLARLPEVRVLTAVGEIGPAIEAVGYLRPDVVLLEPRTGDGTPVATLWRFVGMNSPVVILTSSLVEGEAEGYMRTGAYAALLKDSDVLGLLRRIRVAIGVQEPRAIARA